jgi:hypothetical protein
MISVKRIAAGTAMLFCAMGTGLVVQHVLRGGGSAAGPGVQVASVDAGQGMSDVAAAPAEADTGIPAGADAGNETPSAPLPTPPVAAPQPDTLPDAPVTVAALEDQPISAPPAEEPAPAFGCEVAVSAETLAAAMVEVTVKAPCMANTRFSVHHNAMVFTATTDDTGERRLSVPALSETAVFIVNFATGESAVARAEVTALEYYDRAVVQWRGKGGLQLHALEYGAAYGEAGHVWADAPRDMGQAASGAGGFLTRLGDAGVPSPRRAEVYTFPSGTTPRGGRVRLSLEAEVSADNCGQDIAAQTLQKSLGGRMQARELTLAMPPCDATGDFLVLKNVFDDLNIARN